MRQRIALLFLLACAPGLAPAQPQQVTLRFVYVDTPLYPYYIGHGQLIPDNPGVSIELVKLLEKKVPGLKVELARMPWKRCLLSLKQGSADALVASFRPERQENGVYPTRPDGRPDPSRRMETHNYVLYKRKSSTLSWNGKRFDRVDGAIGAPLGNSIVEDLRGHGVTVEESQSFVNNLRKLLAGRLAGVATLETVGDFQLGRSQYTEVVKMSPVLASKDYYLMFSHQFIDKHPRLANDIWKALAEIRTSYSTTLMFRYMKMTAEY